MKQTKTDNQKLKKNDQQNLELDVELQNAAVFQNFYDTYSSPPKEMTNLAQESNLLKQDLKYFQEFFESNEELPEYIKTEHLRSLLGKRPGTFCWFLKYPTFYEMLLGVPQGCEPEEKSSGRGYLNGLMATAKNKIDGINQEIAKREENINRIKKEIAKRNEKINQIKSNEDIDGIKEEIVKADEEINKIKAEIDERNRGEKADWLKLQKEVNVYINGSIIYSNLMKCVSGKTINISELKNICLQLIACLKNRSHLPEYIEPRGLQEVILRAPVTTSVFFNHINFVKRLQGILPDKPKSETDGEFWNTFFLKFAHKIKSAVPLSDTLPTDKQEQLTKAEREKMFKMINQSLSLIKEEEKSRDYDQGCKDLAEVIERSYTQTKSFLEKHPDLLDSSIEKGIPPSLTATHLKRLLTFAPEYVMKYMDNYDFMARLMADDIKKGTTLTANDIFDELQSKFELVELPGKKKVELLLLLKHWEIRLRLHLRITLLIREVIKLSQPTAPQKNLQEDKSRKSIFNLSDKRVLSDISKKLNELLVGITHSTEYKWIDELKEFIIKLSESLPNDNLLMYGDIKLITKEINSFLSNEDLLEEVKTRAQLFQKNILDVVANEDEYPLSANALSP